MPPAVAQRLQCYSFVMFCFNDSFDLLVDAVKPIVCCNDVSSPADSDVRVEAFFENGVVVELVTLGS